MSESLIHIKLEYDESLKTKIGVLNIQKEFITLLKTVKHYHAIRSEELKLRLIIQKKIKDLKLNISKLEQILPKIRIPDILKREVNEEVRSESTPKKMKKQDYDKNIEDQLKEIQERLKKLSN